MGKRVWQDALYTEFYAPRIEDDAELRMADTFRRIQTILLAEHNGLIVEFIIPHITAYHQKRSLLISLSISIKASSSAVINTRCP